MSGADAPAVPSAEWLVEQVEWTDPRALALRDAMDAEIGPRYAGRLDDVPQAAGFLAASLGLSRMFRDDLAQLDAGMLLYDAFYRWCRDATEETHNWPSVPVKN